MQSIWTSERADVVLENLWVENIEEQNRYWIHEIGFNWNGSFVIMTQMLELGIYLMNNLSVS
jgi:hypothetical protein